MPLPLGWGSPAGGNFRAPAHERALGLKWFEMVLLVVMLS